MTGPVGIAAVQDAVVARLLAGKMVVGMMTEGRGFSNAKAKRDLRWRPVHPSWRHGFAAA